MNAFRLPDETRVAQVHLRTADLGRALAFYRDVLGLKVISRTQATASLSAGGALPAIVVLTEDPNALPRLHRTTGLFHLAIRYPNREALAHAVNRLAANRVPIHGASDHIVSEAIYLADTDGNGVELYTDRPRSTWDWRNGEVKMATEPLDLDNLLATGNGQTTPPPPETDLGHIHLHVADLKTAEKFFHDFLGLAITQRSYPGALFLAADGYHHHIAVNTWAGKAAPPPNSVGLVAYRLIVPSGTTLNDLEKRSAEFGLEIMRRTAENGNEILRVRDPNGNWMEVESASAKTSSKELSSKIDQVRRAQ